MLQVIKLDALYLYSLLLTEVLNFYVLKNCHSEDNFVIAIFWPLPRDHIDIYLFSYKCFEVFL